MDSNVKLFVKLTILLVFFVMIHSTDIHTSTFLLEKLMEKEILFHSIIRNYVEMVEIYSSTVRKYRKREFYVDYKKVLNLKKESRNIRKEGQNIVNLTSTKMIN